VHSCDLLRACDCMYASGLPLGVQLPSATGGVGGVLGGMMRSMFPGDLGAKETLGWSALGVHVLRHDLLCHHVSLTKLARCALG